MITPFRGEYVDLQTLHGLIDEFARTGCQGIVVCGTTGEPGSLTLLEKEQVLNTVLEAGAGRLKIAMGLSGSDTGDLCRHAAHWSTFAIDALLVSAPPYVRPSQQGIALHFEAIARHTDRPIVAYDIPGRTGVTIELSTLTRLNESARVAAVKLSAGADADRSADVQSLGSVALLCGEDSMLYVSACLGAPGAITASAHLFPRQFVALLEDIASQRLVQARQRWQWLRPLTRLLFSEPNPAPIKAAMRLQGRLPDASLRLPMSEISVDGRVALARWLDTEGRRPPGL